MKLDIFFPLVISSPSGGGKTTVKNMLVNRYDIFEFSITCTTRALRDGEKNGVDYYFLSDDEFDRRIKSGEFLEWALVHGKKYGSLRKTVNDILLRKHIPVMTVDVVGAMNIKKEIPTSLLLFILPPDFETMIKRLKLRGESDEEIRKRMKTALTEIDYASKFDFVIINDKIEDTLSSIIDAVKSHSNRFSFRSEVVYDIKRSIENYLQGG
ncbi:MAG: guanylate kinase [Elusimicrobiales bacterium]